MVIVRGLAEHPDNNLPLKHVDIKAAKVVERRKGMPNLAPLIMQSLNGVSLAMILVLISLGLAITFGLMGVINLAHCELFMLGAYTVVAVNQFIIPNFWAGVILAPIVVGLVGLFMEKTIIKRLYQRPLETLLATWGVSIVLRQFVKVVMGVGHKMVIPPMTGVVPLFAGVGYPVYRFFIIGITLLVLVVVFFILLRTGLGLQCRAVIANRQMASALGINTAMCDSFVFTLGAALAGLAGAIMSPLVTVNSEMGLVFLAKVFFVVILGGLGNLMGVIGGGAIIGGAETAISYFSSSVIAQICVFILAIIVIRVRPKGLFGGVD